MKSPAVRSHCSIFSVVIALLSLAGVAAIWLPFTFGISPAEAIADRELWQLAAPFFLVFAIAAAHVWRLAQGQLPASARLTARILSGCGMIILALIYSSAIRAGDWPDSGKRELVAFVLPLTIAAGWIVLMLRWHPGRQSPSSEEAIALMEMPYLADAAICLVSFYDNLESGGYLTLIAAAAFAAHVIAAMRCSARFPQRQPN